MFSPILIQYFGPLALGTILYLVAFKLRKLEATLLSCIVIAGAPVLIGFVPVPLGTLLRLLFGYGLAVFLTSRYTQADIFPDGLLIPLCVQTITHLLVLVLLAYIL